MREAVELIAPDKLKDVLIYRTASKTLCSQDLVEKVISHQFKSARDAFKLYKEVEITGFGKFQVSKAKIRRKKERLLEMIIKIEERLTNPLPDWRVKQYQTRLDSLKETLAYVETKETRDEI